ncbi:ankyrin repeat domain-containing protein [Psychromonas sp. MME2]|uniref:ankyrin repeat domain-containing protein n=1 Tax=unclassified Psychromonas TaxID=2614957 RepID=UPI00339C7D27
MRNEKEISLLAYQGKWEMLIRMLREHPRYVNVQSQSNGYTPLHQAAWHGATLEVIGVLLSLGADCRIKTTDKGLTALNIAVINHPERADLVYALSERRMTIAQLIRKVIATQPDLFDAYDGNQVLADRFIGSFGVDSCPENPDKLIKRFEASFRALTGVNITSSRKIIFSLAEGFDLQVDTPFWKSRFLPILREFADQSATIALEKEWLVVSDLFDPAPGHWGLRGDLFLWMEMRQALCHVSVPENPSDLASIIKSTFHALTGESLENNGKFYVSRFARGGMDGGIACSFWIEKLIPMIEQRLRWLQNMWGFDNESRTVR